MATFDQAVKTQKRLIGGVIRDVAFDDDGSVRLIVAYGDYTTPIQISDREVEWQVSAKDCDGCMYAFKPTDGRDWPLEPGYWYCDDCFSERLTEENDA